MSERTQQRPGQPGDQPGQPGRPVSLEQTTDLTRNYHSTEVEPGQPSAGSLARGFPDPGLPAHVHRSTDTDPKAAKRAERQVAALFALSALGVVIFSVAYFAVPLEDIRDTSVSTRLLGIGLALSMFCLGAGAVHWAKKLMPDDEVVEERHPVRSTDEERVAAVAVLEEGAEATGFPRRRLIWASLTGALGAAALPALLPLWDLWHRDKGAGNSPAEQFSRTPWHEGVHLVTDPQKQKILASDVPIGSVVHVLPEVDEEDPEAPEGEHAGLTLNEIAKAAVLLIRLEPDELVEPTRLDWTYNGLVAYSKICSHVGCPVGLYEQTTHHLLCPCHQSTFDVTRGCEVVFGPAGRPLPQLAITADEEGYLVAQRGFEEPPGPSFWERT